MLIEGVGFDVEWLNGCLDIIAATDRLDELVRRLQQDGGDAGAVAGADVGAVLLLALVQQLREELEEPPQRRDWGGKSIALKRGPKKEISTSNFIKGTEKRLEKGTSCRGPFGNFYRRIHQMMLKI